MCCVSTKVVRSQKVSGEIVVFTGRRAPARRKLGAWYESRALVMPSASDVPFLSEPGEEVDPDLTCEDVGVQGNLPVSCLFVCCTRCLKTSFI